MFLDNLYYENIVYKICYHCAPVILGIKTANTLSILNSSQKVFYYIINKINLETSVLCDDGKKLVVMVYNRKLLEKNIFYGQNEILLNQMGYNGLDLNGKLILLRYRFYEYKFYNKRFPHELGLFLNYPLYDVLGFMNNNGKGYILSGYWKVYSDKDTAMKTFKIYDDARNYLLTAIE